MSLRSPPLRRSTVRALLTAKHNELHAAQVEALTFAAALVAGDDGHGLTVDGADTFDDLVSEARDLIDQEASDLLVGCYGSASVHARYIIEGQRRVWCDVDDEPYFPDPELHDLANAIREDEDAVPGEAGEATEQTFTFPAASLTIEITPVVGDGWRHLGSIFGGGEAYTAPIGTAPPSDRGEPLKFVSLDECDNLTFAGVEDTERIEPGEVIVGYGTYARLRDAANADDQSAYAAAVNEVHIEPEPDALPDTDLFDNLRAALAAYDHLVKAQELVEAITGDTLTGGRDGMRGLLSGEITSGRFGDTEDCPADYTGLLADCVGTGPACDQQIPADTHGGLLDAAVAQGRVNPDPPAATTPFDDQLDRIADWLLDHPNLIGEGAAIDNAIRLLDHAYAGGTREPHLLSAATPNVVALDETDEVVEVSTAEAERPVYISVNVINAEPATVAADAG